MKVFIMGMHRSGTSMITGALSLCGLHVGINLLTGARDNPKGHFEEKTFLNINNQLLIRNGGSWHKPPKSISYAGLRSKMIEFLDRPEWRKHEFVGWKDPRICLTFPLWYDLLYPEPIKVILIRRRIEDVVASLTRRNGFSKSKGIKLAQYYRRNAYANIQRRGVTHFVTNFEAYFTTQAITVELRDVCEFVGLKLPSEKISLHNFIDPKLRHHKGAS